MTAPGSIRQRRYRARRAASKTPEWHRVLLAIESHWRARQTGPLPRDICVFVGLPTERIRDHVNYLRRRGWLVPSRGQGHVAELCMTLDGLLELWDRAPVADQDPHPGASSEDGGAMSGMAAE